jgi:3-phenylpropionate/cinnamic acid dioxygenase small subunit
MDASEILNIKDACQSLSLRYGRLQDERNYEGLRDLMTPDGTYMRLDEELTLNEFITWVATMPPNKTRHFVTATDFNEVNETTAKGITYYTLYLYGGDEETPYPLEGPFVVGEYHEEFAKTDKGWKIKSRAAHIIFRKPKK